MGIILTNGQNAEFVGIKFTHSLQTILVAKDVEINHCLFRFFTDIFTGTLLKTYSAFNTGTCPRLKLFMQFCCQG